MKRAFLFSLGCLLALGVLLTAGCTSYDAQVFQKKSALQDAKHFFVLTNLNDNHGIANLIAGALKLRGNEAEVGPLTMMPDDTQIVISYEDRWTWDFGDHLVMLQITARERRGAQPLAIVRFSAKIPKHKATADTVGDLIDRLLPDKKP
jgi:hypothetical protein